MEKQFSISKEQFKSLSSAWKSSESHTASEHVIYNILRGKSARNGFVARTKNIQGNDAWFAFKKAQKEALSSVSTANPWGKYKDTPHHASFESGEKRIEEKRRKFRVSFGLDLTDGLFDILKSGVGNG